MQFITKGNQQEQQQQRQKQRNISSEWPLRSELAKADGEWSGKYLNVFRVIDQS